MIYSKRRGSLNGVLTRKWATRYFDFTIPNFLVFGKICSTLQFSSKC